MAEKRDIASNKEAYDYLIKAEIFANLHATLFERVSSHLKYIENPAHAVLGPSASFMPYASHPEWLTETFSKGGLILVDYNQELLDRAGKALETISSGLLKNSALIEHNLKSGIPLETESADCIEATLTLHHVAPYRHQLYELAEDLHRSLKEGGMLFWGDGFVDMRYTEDLLVDLANSLSVSEGRHINLVDMRDPDYPMMIGSNGRYHDITECDREDYKFAHAYVGSEGIVHHNPPTDVVSYPLVNVLRPAHVEHHIKPIRDFYTAHIPMIQSLYRFGADHKMIGKILEAQAKEMNYALRGLVEFYSSKELMVDCLEKVGFKDIKVIDTSEGLVPEYARIGAIVAYKR